MKQMVCARIVLETLPETLPVLRNELYHRSPKNVNPAEKIPKYSRKEDDMHKQDCGNGSYTPRAGCFGGGTLFMMRKAAKRLCTLALNERKRAEPAAKQTVDCSRYPPQSALCDVSSYFSWNTRSPATKVSVTLARSTCSGGSARISLSHTAKSASIPGNIFPFRSSMPSARAPKAV